MFTHRMQTNFTRGGTTHTTTIDKQYSGEANVDETIVHSGTNVEVDIAINNTTLKSLYISSDVDLTLKANSSGSPAFTLNVKAGAPLWWDATNVGTFTNPITAAVTKFYVTNADGTNDAALKIFALMDSTP